MWRTVIRLNALGQNRALTAASATVAFSILSENLPHSLL